jgi:flagella basal body P-ring formation protein FlgA
MVFYLGAVSLFAAAGNPLNVRLQERVSVIGPEFSIGDVAKVTGVDEAVCERVRKVKVGRAPLPKQALTLTAASLRVALRKASLLGAEVVVAEGESVITTESQTYLLQNLLPLIRTDVLRATGEVPANVQVDPSPAFEKMLVLPKGKVTVQLRPPMSGRYDGSVLYVTDLSVDGRKVKSLPMRVTVRIERPVVVSTRRLERGEKFDEGNVEIRRLSTGVNADSVTLMSQVVGKPTSRVVFPGTSLRFQDIADPPLIKRGQEVTCRGRKGNVEIEVMVKALEDGKLGRVIRVQNTGSQKLLKARVVDEMTVDAVAGP